MISIPKRSFKAGQAPGTLVYMGAHDQEKPVISISLIDYDKEALEIKEIADLNESKDYLNTATTTWINVTGLHDIKLLETAGKLFNLHPLVLEDILNLNHRPKTEDYEDYIFTTIKAIELDPKTDEFVSEQISIITMPNIVITFTEKPSNLFEPVRKRIADNRVRIRSGGANYLTYALLDRIVDNFFIVFEEMYTEMEEIELRITENPNRDDLDRLFKLKRTNLLLRKSIVPARDILRTFLNEDYCNLGSEVEPFLRDVNDHILESIETVDNIRDVITGLVESYNSAMSNRMNEVMKVLTIVASLFIPLTFIAGIYGMNFQYMPELSWRMGYFTALGIMAIIFVGMLWYFKKKDWL